MLFIPPRFTFVDVGAYDGAVSRRYCAFLDAIPERFYLIEPNPVSFRSLVKTMKGYHLYEMAISDHDGEEAFYYHVDHLNASSIFKDMPAGKGVTPFQISVPCMTLDSFMKHTEIEHINFLKVNCEGGELKMFKAPTVDFLNHTTYILISFHGKRYVFNSEEATAEKIRINNLLFESGFRFIDGVHPKVLSQAKDKSHELQIWKRD